jgi:hypothetical protein
VDANDAAIMTANEYPRLAGCKRVRIDASQVSTDSGKAQVLKKIIEGDWILLDGAR